MLKIKACSPQSEPDHFWISAPSLFSFVFLYYYIITLEAWCTKFMHWRGRGLSPACTLWQSGSRGGHIRQLDILSAAVEVGDAPAIVSALASFEPGLWLSAPPSPLWEHTDYEESAPALKVCPPSGQCASQRPVVWLICILAVYYIGRYAMTRTCQCCFSLHKPSFSSSIFQ